MLFPPSSRMQGPNGNTNSCISMNMSVSMNMSASCIPSAPMGMSLTNVRPVMPGRYSGTGFGYNNAWMNHGSGQYISVNNEGFGSNQPLQKQPLVSDGLGSTSGVTKAVNIKKNSENDSATFNNTQEKNTSVVEPLPPPPTPSALLARIGKSILERQMQTKEYKISKTFKISSDKVCLKLPNKTSSEPLLRGEDDEKICNDLKAKSFELKRKEETSKLQLKSNIVTSNKIPFENNFDMKLPGFIKADVDMYGPMSGMLMQSGPYPMHEAPVFSGPSQISELAIFNIPKHMYELGMFNGPGPMGMFLGPGHTGGVQNMIMNDSSCGTLAGMQNMRGPGFSPSQFNCEVRSMGPSRSYGPKISNMQQFEGLQPPRPENFIGMCQGPRTIHGPDMMQFRYPRKTPDVTGRFIGPKTDGNDMGVINGPVPFVLNHPDGLVDYECVAKELEKPNKKRNTKLVSRKMSSQQANNDEPPHDPKKPWITPEIWKEIRKKYELQKVAKESGTAQAWRIFKIQRNRVASLLRDSKVRLGFPRGGSKGNKLNLAMKRRAKR
ncbi:uncharacterized protein LOC143232829 isoform X3 [Tachypleus tridentatus]